MAEITKVALKVDNNNSFPNNNAGAITPAILRAFNVNMIDSMVDEIGYNADSASWNVSISNINAFTASAQSLTTSSLLITASAQPNSNVITFTKGNGSTFNVTVATGSIPDISNLNQATASLQAFTASAQISINNLNTTTASLNSSVTQLNANTASQQVSINALNQSSASQQVSIDSINSKTGSFATTGSNTFVSANTFTSISASSFVSASQFVGDGSKITNITASIALPILDEGIPQGNAFSMNFTGSGIGATIVGGIAIVSVYAPDSASFNSLTASFNAYTASTNSSITQLNANTASQQVSIDNLNLYTSSFNVNTLVTTASFNSYTSSNNQRVSSLETNSASVNTSISALNTYTASQSTASLVTSITNLNTFSASALVSISNINSTTASLNTSVTNINSATASLFTSASLALVTASFDTGTRNLTFTKGNTTQFSVNIPDVSGSAGTFVTTSSFNAYTQSNDQRVTALETNSASVNISITNINSTTASLNTSVTNLNQFTASQSTASIVNSITELNTFSASALISINNINQTTASLNTSVTNLNQFTASQSTASLVTSITELNTFSASAKISITNLNTTTASLNTFTSSVVLLNANNRITGSQIMSGSLNLTGSAFGNVVALSITSNTASMDLNLGNYFTLTLANTATTHISASNVQPGVSATLVITTGTNSSASLAPTMLQPSGSSYSATAGSSKKDVLSIVAVASGVPFVVSTKNMI